MPSDRQRLQEAVERIGIPAPEHLLGLLDLPEDPRFLSRVVDRACRGLCDGAQRLDRFGDYANGLVAQLERVQELQSQLPMLFGRAIQSNPRTRSLSTGLRRSHPWYSALLTEVSGDISGPARDHVFGVGTLAAALLTESRPGAVPADTILAGFGLALCRLLESESSVGKFSQVFAPFLQTPDGKPAPLWVIHLHVVDAIARTGSDERGLFSDFLRRYATLAKRLLQWQPGPSPLSGWTRVSSPSRRITTLSGWDDELPGELGVLFPPPVTDETGLPEAPAVPVIGFGPDTEADQPARSEQTEAVLAQVAWSHGADHRTLRPYAWGRLTAEEEHQLLETLRNAPPGDRACAGTVMSALLLGKPGEPDPACRNLELVPRTDAFSPSSLEADRYRPRIDRVRLLARASARTTRPAASEGPSDSPPDVAGFLQRLRRDLPRLSASRISRALPGKLLDATGDRTLIELLFSDTVAGTSAAGYYAAYSLDGACEVLSKQAGIDLETTDGETGSDAVIGSAGVPVDTRFQASVSALRTTAIAALSDASRPVAERHNAYSNYVVALLLCATGHRLVTDPFFDRRTLFPERRFALISDKASSTSHTARLAPLPELAGRQVQAYEAHLRSLSRELCYRGSPLGHRVGDLAAGRGYGGMPFFFYLTQKNETSGPDDLDWLSVSPATFRQPAGAWPWHASAHRHLLSTQLRARGVPPEYVDHALGHWALGESPLGLASMLRACDYLPQVADAVQGLLVRWGFDVVPGLRAHRPPQAYRAAAVPTPDDGGAKPLLGPFSRLESRQDRARQDKMAVRAALARAEEELGAGQQPLTPEARDAVVLRARELVIDASGAQAYRLARRLELFRRVLRRRRFLWEEKSRGDPVRLIGKVYAPPDDPALVADLTGARLQRGAALRAAFAQWLESPEHCTEEPISLTTIALLSAIILGGLVGEEDPRRFVEAIPGRAFRVGGIDWLMLDRGGRESRYLGDSVTRMLYGRAAERALETGITPGYSAVARVAGRIVRQFTGERLSLDRLVRVMREDLATRVSGVVGGALTGAIDHWTLPDGAWLRLMTGRPLQFTPAARGAPETTGPGVWPSSLDPPRRPSDRDARKQMTDFKKILADRAEKEGEGDKRLSERNRAKRARIRRELIRFRGRLEKTGSWPITRHCVDFALKLLTEGGTRKKHLAPSTILAYAGRNALALLDVFQQADPCTMDAEERADAYGLVLGPAGEHAGGRAGRARRAFFLYLLDQYLCQTYHLQQPSWMEIEPGLFGQVGQTDANLLTRPEIEALEFFERKGNTEPAEVAELLPQVSRAMREAGLRFGESYRLGDLDRQADGRGYLYLVRSSEAGSVKTARSTRIAPAVRVSPPDPSSAGTHRPVPVPLPPDATARVDDPLRQSVHAELAAACRWASGDLDVRPHHLRHGLLCELVALGAGIPHPLLQRAAGASSIQDYLQRAQAVRTRLTRRSEKTALYLTAAARTVGHARPTTSLSSYTHVLDAVAAAELDAAAPRLSSDALGRWLGVSGSAIRMSIRRKQNEDHQSSEVPLLAQLLLDLRRNDLWPVDLTRPLLARRSNDRKAGVNDAGRSLDLARLLETLARLAQGHSLGDTCQSLAIKEAILTSSIGGLMELDHVSKLDLFHLKDARWTDGRRHLVWSTPVHQEEARQELADLLEKFQVPRVASVFRQLGRNQRHIDRMAARHLGGLLGAAWNQRAGRFMFGNPEVCETATQILAVLCPPSVQMTRHFPLAARGDTGGKPINEAATAPAAIGPQPQEPHGILRNVIHIQVVGITARAAAQLLLLSLGGLDGLECDPSQ